MVIIKKNASIKIAVVGSANTDFVLSCPSLPKPGETIMGHSLEQWPGGKGANQAVAAARAGAKVQFIGATGDDALGHSMRAQLRAEGVGLRGSVVLPKQKSGMAFILWGEKESDNSIAVAPGANAELKPRHIDAALPILKASTVWLTQFEIPMATVARLAYWAFQLKKTFIVNPAPAQEIPNSLLQRITVLTPNVHEAEALTGKTNPEASARDLCQRGCRHVVLTLGSEGALWAQQGEVKVIRFQAPKVKAIDTVGAGDCFNAWLALGSAEEMNMEASVRRAIRASAMSVTRKGAQAGMPFRRELP